MPLPTRRISERVAKMIKASLWEGDQSQWKIAMEWGTTQATVSNILRGYCHPEIKWPDGSEGDMPVERYEHLNWLHGAKRWKRTDKYKQEHKYSPEAERAGDILKEVRDRIDAGEDIDDIKFDDSGNLIPKKSETP